jgi:nitroimidazol reductase NimA-like FMN-containing flavoprotein (pyridoxamine 5'-phosphate oxidase superfamily)
MVELLRRYFPLVLDTARSRAVSVSVCPGPRRRMLLQQTDDRLQHAFAHDVACKVLTTAYLLEGTPVASMSPSSPGSDLHGVTLEEIAVAECWRLLATHQVGRVAVIVGRYPLVFPVNYVLDGMHIMFRTSAGTKLWAIKRSNVTFEVDDLELESRSGWSVMVCGAAQELDIVKGRGAARRSNGASPTPWAPGQRDHTVRIVPDQVTGRRISPMPPAPSSYPSRWDGELIWPHFGPL